MLASNHLNPLAKPLIGITAAAYVDPKSGWRYFRSYSGCVAAIADNGGLPVLVPAGLPDEVLRAIYDRLDGVLMPGGGDVNPAVYGEAPHPTTVYVDDARDATELQLVRWAVDEDRPLLGICRGHQLINVALGGKLLQDIPSSVSTKLLHDIPDYETPRFTRSHEVSIDPASRLAQVTGVTTLAVNSLHHQSVSQVAPAMRVTAYAPDGVIEATELPDRQFVLSVQWHPEDLYGDDPAIRRLFTAFVDAARQQMHVNGRSAESAG